MSQCRKRSVASRTSKAIARIDARPLDLDYVAKTDSWRVMVLGAEERPKGLVEPLIQAMIDCVQPSPSDTLVDPAAGTAGFLMAAHEYVVWHHPHLDPTIAVICAPTSPPATSWSTTPPGWPR